jgi:hypothetical protein
LFLDPEKLKEATPTEILDSAARGHLGLDHRFLHALIDRREESLPAAVEFSKRDRSQDPVDLAPELVALFHYWNGPEGIPFLTAYLRESPEEIPDEAIEALVSMGQPALEPLLSLYHDLDEAENGEIAFIIANLRVRDDRILRLLLDRLEYDPSDTALLLSIYGDPAAISALKSAAEGLGEGDAELKKEIADAISTISQGGESGPEPIEPLDIWALYPAKADLPVDMIDEDERLELLDYPVESIRASAAGSFFNRELTKGQRDKLLRTAQNDPSPQVRARAWEALTNLTEDTEVIDAMLTALRNPQLPVEERSGLLVGLAPEADRNEVKDAISALYEIPEARAKALEAMWRSMHPSFRNNFAKHLDDPDVEVRRSAVWGVGYHGLKGELDRLRKFFDDEELRSDALFAYALALPSDISRGRIKGLLARIEKDVHGLSEMEEELVKAALDERLMLAGKEPVFREQED